MAETLTVVPAQWSDEAGVVLVRAVGADTLPDIKHQVENGASLFHVVDRAGQTVGYYVLRVDFDMRGAEGVVVAGAGRAGMDLLDLLLPSIEKQFSGCYAVRVHTTRPGVVKKLVAHGYGATELTVRKKING